MAQDNWSGVKRLAKTLDTLYPAEVELGVKDDEDGDSDRPAGGVMGALRNVLGKTRDQQSTTERRQLYGSSHPVRSRVGLNAVYMVEF